MLMLDARAEQPSAQSTIVLYNKAAPDSVELAKFYAEQRGVAADHLAGLNCSTEEEISREEYNTTIAGPLREIFKQRHWWILRESTDRPPAITSSEIHFVAVIKGMPLKIRSTTDYPGDQPRPGPTGKRNNASVDSELALLGLYSPQISGFVSNPYFQSFRAINDFGNPALLLVCRLDAPDVAMVRNMIIDAIVTEKKALWGRAYVDGGHSGGGARDLGDQWLSEIPGQLHKVGVPVIYDESPEIFPPGYPMTDCALYYGWYAEKMAGPFTRPDFHFVPGAIAVHIHSYSANTLRDANANWVAPLISKGQPPVWATCMSHFCNSLRASTPSTIDCCTASPLPRAPTCRSRRSPGCRSWSAIRSTGRTRSGFRLSRKARLQRTRPIGRRIMNLP
jgi:uncharacterized protein (TIGR03790 family)